MEAPGKQGKGGVLAGRFEGFGVRWGGEPYCAWTIESDVIGDFTEGRRLAVGDAI